MAETLQLFKNILKKALKLKKKKIHASPFYSFFYKKLNFGQGVGGEHLNMAISQA